MSDNARFVPSPSDSQETELLRSLDSHLTEDERKVRDHELIAQANKFFGGLNAEERRMLGLADACAESIDPSKDFEKSTELEASAYTRPQTQLYEWIYVILSLAAFTGMFCWVVGTH